jgi:hypothetical protein
MQPMAYSAPVSCFSTEAKHQLGILVRYFSFFRPHPKMGEKRIISLDCQRANLSYHLLSKKFASHDTILIIAVSNKSQYFIRKSKSRALFCIKTGKIAATCA